MSHAGGFGESGGQQIFTGGGFGGFGGSGGDSGPSIAQQFGLGGSFADIAELQRRIDAQAAAERLAAQPSLPTVAPPRPRFIAPFSTLPGILQAPPAPTPTGPIPGMPPSGAPGTGVGTGDPRIVVLQVLLNFLQGIIQGRPRAPKTTVNQFFNTTTFPQTTGVVPMPNVPTLVAGLPGSGGLFGGGGGILDSLLGAAPSIISALGLGGSSGGGGSVAQPVAMPGGAPIAIPAVFGMEQGGFGGAVGGFLGGTCITPRASQSLRLPSRVDVPTVDSSGNMRFTTFKNVGRPVLWTGDIAIAKRVKKIAGRARRASGGR